MAHYLFVLLLLSSTAFAQRVDVKTKVLKKTARLSQMIDRNLDNLSPSELREINQILKTAIEDTKYVITGSVNAPRNPRGQTSPLPFPIPRNTRATRAGLLECKWMNGYSEGISKRGYHLLSQPRGIFYSEKFYGNNSVESYRNCMKDALVDLVTAYELDSAKSTTCACDWYPGTNREEPRARGYHMSYEVRVPTISGEISYLVTSGYFGNNSTQSKEACQRQLIQNGFSCQ